MSFSQTLLVPQEWNALDLVLYIMGFQVAEKCHHLVHYGCGVTVIADSLSQITLFTNSFISLNFIPGSLGNSVAPLAFFCPVELCDLLTPAESERLGFSHLFMISIEWVRVTEDTWYRVLFPVTPRPRPEQEVPPCYWSQICSDSYQTPFQIAQRELLATHCLASSRHWELFSDESWPSITFSLRLSPFCLSQNWAKRKLLRVFLKALYWTWTEHSSLLSGRSDFLKNF